MPQIETWSRLPAAVRAHLVERMHDRKISLEDLNQLRCRRPRGIGFNRAQPLNYQSRRALDRPATVSPLSVERSCRGKLQTEVLVRTAFILCVMTIGKMVSALEGVSGCTKSSDLR